MPMLGLALVQKGAENSNTPSSKGKNINVIENDIIVHTNWARTQFPALFTRTGRFNNHKVKTKIKTPFVAKQQKGRRIPLVIQERVASEVERLMARGILSVSETARMINSCRRS